MLKYYWYLTTYVRKHGWLVLGSVIVTIIAFTLAIPLISTYLDAKPRRFVGVVGSYEISSLPPEIENKISLGLTAIDKDGSVKPSISERWSIEENGTTYRFIIRPNLKWHDGSSFGPEDVNYSFQNVEKISTANDVVFKLPEVFVPFPIAVTKPLLKTNVVRQYFFFKKNRIIGLGEYQVSDYSLQGPRLKELVLDSPKERIIYRFYLTENDAVIAFKHGKVDQLENLTTTYGLDTWETVKIQTSVDTQSFLAVFFNNNHPLFTKNIRQGLNYALPKNQSSLRAIGPISPNSWAYFEGGKDYTFDQERALERLFDTPPEQRLQFTLKTTQTFASEAESIKRAWEAFGNIAVEKCATASAIENKDVCPNYAIEVNIRIESAPDTSDFEALLIGQIIPPDPDQYMYWHSDQPANFTQYKNTRIDKLLEDGRKTADKEERKAIYQEFQQFFLEDSPAIFLNHLQKYNVSR